MASSESNTFKESTSTRENMPTENTATQIQNELEMEIETDKQALSTSANLNTAPVPAEATASVTHRLASYRGIRLSETDVNDEQPAEDSWWSEVENNDLLLDQVPNVTAVFTPTPEAILEKSISLAESESVLKEENFERLHKIADKIKMTLSEHAKNKEIEEKAERERKLSENSDKENKTGYCDTDYSNGNTDSGTVLNTGSVHKEQSLEEFKEELRTKRLLRQNAVQDLRDEIATLRRQLALEREVNKRLRRDEHIEETSFNSTLDSDISTEGACGLDLGDDTNPSSRSRHANIELANAQLALQMANSENISLCNELAVVQKQVVTLKEVIACCKQMLAVKEEQCNELKQRLTEIEKSFAEHETKIMSDNLRQEYERQLVNIRQLRQLYEERQRVAAAEYENLQRLISIKRDELAQEQNNSKSLEERNQNLMKEIELANNELACLRDECKEHKFEKAVLKEEIGAVNTLFSQMVMGFNGKNNLDIDRLTTMLEENRTLLNDMATKECADGATLPKLLFELVEQATDTQDDNKKLTTHLQYSRSPSPGIKETPDNIKINAKQQTAELLENQEYENDNENITSLTANVEELQQHEHEIPSPQSAASCLVNCNSNTAPAATTPDVLTQIYGNDDVDVATNNADEKVIVTAQYKTNNNGKKYHRKQVTNNKKSFLSSSTSAAGHSASVVMQQLHDAEAIGKVTSAQEIVGNLPKVWRVLMELLSHHKIDPVQFEENGKSEDCYKSVETPNGPIAELSVSKTYIKLKDLILEKKSLVKETNRLKTLNSHLDYRLNEQEKRLSAVSLELTKTWHLVGKMQRQHRQLHTQEQILRYQLQQKRRLLSELKDELEYCRRKWAAARAKNDESQEQCNDLRREFARRKIQDANNSAESGYSDSGGPVSDEEIVLQKIEDDVVGSELVKIINIGDDDDLDERNLAAVSTAAGGCVNYRRKRLREMFEHTRKIKRMQSSSPGREAHLMQSDVVVLRWNSAPPTCGWRDGIGLEDEDDIDEVINALTNKESALSSLDRGAIPKAPVRPSRRPKRRSNEKSETDDTKNGNDNTTEASTSDNRACRIQRLEQQCKTLIKQVLETSDNRERLEVQLKRFQDEMSPAQHAVPLNELINKKRYERMTRASSVPATATGSLTAREEEYTRKRSERLERLEEESRQLMSRIKRTSDRGHYLRCSLDRIRRAPPSREGSIESNTEDDTQKPDHEEEQEEQQLSGASSQDNSQSETLPSSNKSNILTAEEEAYTARRTARLQRLEEESKQLLNQLSKNNQRGDNMGNRLDTLHERYKSQEETTSTVNSEAAVAPLKMSMEQRIESIAKISSNREERLRILEEEGRKLINKLSETSERGTQMMDRIAQRELNKQKRSSSTPIRDTSLDKKNSVKLVTEETPIAAAAILPTPKNVACSSIVSEELNERVTITTTASQIAANQGAIPKSKSTLKLLASRPKSARLQKTQNKEVDNAHETLEDMVKRLQALPFPTQKTNLTKPEEVEGHIFEEEPVVKKDIDNFEQLNANNTNILEADELKPDIVELVVENKMNHPRTE